LHVVNLLRDVLLYNNKSFERLKLLHSFRENCKCILSSTKSENSSIYVWKKQLKNMENTMIPITPSLLKGGIVPLGYGDGAGNGLPG
jgi:hypothetical protein